jgi:MtrB/PioB family decaheme-associated outer membrane protein
MHELPFAGAWLEPSFGNQSATLAQRKEEAMKLHFNKQISILRFAFLLLVAFVAAVSAQQSTPKPSPSPAASTVKSAPTEGEEPGIWSNFRYVFEIGGQFRDENGDRPTKTQQYKSIRQGVLFRRFAVSSNPAGERSFFYLTGRNISETDQQYTLEAGSYGRFRTNAAWTAQPHLYSRGSVFLLNSTAPGVYSLSDAIQQNLQSLDPPFNNATTTPNPALIAAAKTFVAAAPRITVRSQRQTLYFEQEINLTPDWTFRFTLLDNKRFGERPLGTGTYERTGTSVGDTFRVHSLELPAQIDYRTTSFTFGTSYTRRNWGVNFDVTFRKFRNEIDAYIYDNPFRLTDQPATGSGNFNRMAFARGIHSVAPDNESFGFMITAFANLPHDSRWAGAFGWSRWKQDEPFLPYTLNTAITAANLGGRSPTDLSTLPQTSLEGEVDNITHDQLFTSRLLKNLTLNLRYRSYEYKNKTEEILFPGYAAFLESFWRTSIVGTYGTRLIENEPLSFLRQRAGGELVWDVTRKFTWRGEYEWEGWNREHRQVSRSNEHKLGTFFSYKPTREIKTDLDYRYQSRKPQSYDPGVLEFNLLRMFDQATRLRHDLRFRWQWAATPKLGISADFSYLSDDFDQNFFGTTRFTERRGGVDLLYNARENTTVYANYSREHYNTSLQSISKSANPTFDLRNRWNRDDRNINDNFGVGLTTFLAKSRWYLDVNYAFNFGRNLITTRNLNQPPTGTLTNATAYPFPEAKIKYHEFTIDSNYQVTPNVALGFRYLFEPFSLDDWQWNNLSAYPVDQLAPETDGRRFLVLDSRYTTQNAHIVSFYVRFGK